MLGFVISKYLQEEQTMNQNISINKAKIDIVATIRLA
jgi:hypothetical protein